MTGGSRYILNGHTPVPEPDLMTWAKAFEFENHDVAQTMVGEARVSTVFLGLDHQWGDGPPLVFETMVFGGPLDGEQDRYSTWDEAAAGHAEMVRRVEQAATEPQS